MNYATPAPPPRPLCGSARVELARRGGEVEAELSE